MDEEARRFRISREENRLRSIEPQRVGREKSRVFVVEAELVAPRNVAGGLDEEEARAVIGLEGAAHFRWAMEPWAAGVNEARRLLTDVTVKIAVIFYSMYGNTAALAKAVGEGATEVGAELRLRQVEELIAKEVIEKNPKLAQAKKKLASIPIATNDDLLWADGVLFGTPTRYGNMCAQLKQFIDQTGKLWLSGKLVGKVAGVFCSTSTLHGGQETTLVSMMIPLFHLGFIVHGLPYAEVEQMSMQEIHGGSPYGASSVSGPDADRMPTEIDLTLARALGRRVAIAAGKLRS